MKGLAKNYGGAFLTKTAIKTALSTNFIVGDLTEAGVRKLIDKEFNREIIGTIAGLAVYTAIGGRYGGPTGALAGAAIYGLTRVAGLIFRLI